MKQSQPRIVFCAERKHWGFRTSITRPNCMARWTQQRYTPWCLFDSCTKEVYSTDIALGHSILEATSEKLGDEKAVFNFSDGSGI